MDPLIIHHVIRHPLSRVETNNFQDKSGCSINGFRSFLFDEGIVRDLDDMESLLHETLIIQDYRGYPIYLEIEGFDNYPLSDEILKMKNVRFDFGNLSKPIHKLVSLEPHFVEEERNLIENHFYNLEYMYDSEDIEDWSCFEMDCEGHLISMIPDLNTTFQLTNKSIEHLSNFPYLRDLNMYSLVSHFVEGRENVTNFFLLSNLKKLEITFQDVHQDPELLKDLGYFSNLLSLHLYRHTSGKGYLNNDF